MYSGLCMTSNNGQLALQPITYAPTQWWVPLPAPTLLNYEPFWRTVSQEVHPNAALPPAQVDLVNSHRNALLVLLADQRAGGQTQQLRIEAGKSIGVTLDRDAGSTIVETYEIRSPSGVWERQQFTTAIPPRVIYDLSVYEEFLQSIAIDRTGKSPNPIEDVNYMPKSVGWIQIPPGAATPRISSLDVMSQARAANNPGAVRRMDVRQFEQEPESPTEAILNEIQSLLGRNFEYEFELSSSHHRNAKEDLVPSQLARSILDATPLLGQKLSRALFIAQAEAELALAEVIKFLALAADNSTGQLTPSVRVDLAWHEFLLFTRTYSSFCDQHLGQFVHHEPSANHAENSKQYLLTLERYRIRFGEPPVEYWPRPAASPRAGCDGDSDRDYQARVAATCGNCESAT